MGLWLRLGLGLRLGLAMYRWVIPLYPYYTLTIPLLWHVHTIGVWYMLTMAMYRFVANHRSMQGLWK